MKIRISPVRYCETLDLNSSARDDLMDSLRAVLVLNLRIVEFLDGNVDDVAYRKS